MILGIIFLAILLWGLYKRIDCFNAFRTGAKNGIETAIQIMPAMVGLMVAIAVFRASGVMDVMVGWLTPVASAFHIPKEVLPLAFLRPVSGSASLAMLHDIFQTVGPDSRVGRIASVMMGSTETVFYTVAVYLSAINVKKTGYIVPVALFCGLFGFVIACILCG